MFKTSENTGLTNYGPLGASINESCPVEVEIARVTGPAGGQGEVNYALSQILQQRGVDEHFRVDSKTGAILLKTPLDYEEDKQYTYVVDKVGEWGFLFVCEWLLRWITKRTNN